MVVNKKIDQALLFIVFSQYCSIMYRYIIVERKKEEYYES